jgi:hypothetical protein
VKRTATVIHPNNNQQDRNKPDKKRALDAPLKSKVNVTINI